MNDVAVFVQVLLVVGEASEAEHALHVGGQAIHAVDPRLGEVSQHLLELPLVLLDYSLDILVAPGRAAVLGHFLQGVGDVLHHRLHHLLRALDALPGPLPITFNGLQCLLRAAGLLVLERLAGGGVVRVRV